MSAPRVVSVIAGVVLLMLLVSAFVREAAVALSDVSSWGVAPGWEAVTEQRSLAAAVAAAVAASAAVACVLLAVRLANEELRRDVVVSGDAGSVTKVDPRALERLVAKRFAHAAPGVKAVTVQLVWQPPHWRLWLYADVPAQDMVALHDTALAVGRDELARAGGIVAARVDLEVRRLLPSRGGDA